MADLKLSLKSGRFSASIMWSSFCAINSMFIAFEGGFPRFDFRVFLFIYQQWRTIDMVRVILQAFILHFMFRPRLIYWCWWTKLGTNWHGTRFLRYVHPSFSWFLSSTVTSRRCCLKEQVLLVIAFPSEPSNKLTSYLSTCRLRTWFGSLR